MENKQEEMTNPTPPKLWVIEMWDEPLSKWMPTVGAGLNRNDAKSTMCLYWKSRNPHGRFRVVQYQRIERKKK